MPLKKVLVGVGLMIISCQISDAQKLDLKSWVKAQRDPLSNLGADTMIYYHRYCGECAVLEQNGDIYSDVLDNGWTHLESSIVYKINRKIFSTSLYGFGRIVKRELTNSYSIDYFVSILPTLKKKVEYGRPKRKKVEFYPPIPTDVRYL